MRVWCFGLVLLLLAVPVRADEVKSYDVPYRLTATHHVMVRARLNGKGPFHFLLDTGAPQLFVGKAVARKLGVEADAKGVGTFGRVEIEGGIILKEVQGRIDDPFQIEGMNRLGLASVELHGIIGYDLLARFRITLDLTRDRMNWTALDFTPPPPEEFKGGPPAELDTLGNLSKQLADIVGKRPPVPVRPRGFLGIELADADGKVRVQAVLEGSPAAAAGARAGDVIQEFQGKRVTSVADVHRLAASLLPEQMVHIMLQRQGQPVEIALPLGKGL